MLDINFIRENKQQVIDAVKNKGLDKKIDIEKLLELDVIRRELVAKRDELRSKRNEISDKIGSASAEDRKPLIEEASKIKEEIKLVEDKHVLVDEEYLSLLLLVPNVTSDRMHVGLNEDFNKVIRAWGEPKKFTDAIKDHVDIGKDLDLIDIETAGRVSGARFYYLKNEAVLLQFALIQLVFTTLQDTKIIKKLADKVGNPFDKAFSPILPPVMMRPDVMKKMDRLDPIDERFQMKLDDLILVGSAEHTLGPYHMDQVLEEKDLPIRYIGYSTAFRREAGSYGKDTRGIIRVHQFDKLEMETLVPEEYGQQEQDLIVSIQEYLMQQLELPYQVIQICTGDAGKPDFNQVDINCWIPSQNKYRETHTSDYMTDFQSRRLGTRYKTKDGNKFVYMNDATAFAIGRTLVAILENNQQKDGSVVIPKVLQKYVGKEVIEPKK